MLPKKIITNPNFLKVINNSNESLAIFDDMIVYMLSDKKRQQVITKLFITITKRNISLAFITQCFFAVPKNIRLNSTHYFNI